MSGNFLPLLMARVRLPLCLKPVPQGLQQPRLPGRTLVKLGEQFTSHGEVPYALRGLLAGAVEMPQRVGIAPATLLR